MTDVLGRIPPNENTSHPCAISANYSSIASILVPACFLRTGFRRALTHWRTSSKKTPPMWKGPSPQADASAISFSLKQPIAGSDARFSFASTGTVTMAIVSSDQLDQLASKTDRVLGTMFAYDANASCPSGSLPEIWFPHSSISTVEECVGVAELPA